MSTKNVILKDKGGNQLAPVTTAEQVRYDETHNVKQAIGQASGHATTANTAADMTDTTRIYVYTGSESGYTAGNWYYYDGSAWVSGGAYTDGLQFETDTELETSGMAADAKVTGDKIVDLTRDFNSALSPEEHTQNLYKGDLANGYLWNCWTADVYKQANESYAAFEIEIPTGTSYISSNYSWANNSYSAFVDNSGAKIGLVKDYAQSGSGYIYEVPSGATKARISFNNSGAGASKLASAGIVYLVGNEDISSKTEEDYPVSAKHYYADDLRLKVEDNKKLDEIIPSIFDAFSMEEKLVNRCTEAQSGIYYVAWNDGDSIVATANESYMGAIIDVTDCEYITLNYNWVGNSFSFFAGSDNKRLSRVIDSKTTDSGYVYAVPTGTVKAYLSQNISGASAEPYSTKGVVVLSGREDITGASYTKDNYPYGETETFYYADDLRLKTQDDAKVSSVIDKIYNGEKKIYTCLKDGTGDFSSLVEAVNTLTEMMDATLYVGPGTWDIIDELGETYMNNVSSVNTTWGLVLKNRIHLIGSSKAVITAKYTGSNTDVTTYFSVFNAGKNGFTLENINIEDDKIRYSVHDDRGGSSFNEHYINRYIACSMKHTNGMYSDCIGGGLGIDALIEIINCYFEGDVGRSRLAYYHGNSYRGETNVKCKIIVTGNYFANDGTFKLTKYGDSTLVSEAYVSNNSFGSAPEVDSGSYAPQDNMKMIEWNNEIRSA